MNIRKIELYTETPTQFELCDTAADTQRRREEREQRKREEAEKQQREEREEARRAETPQSHTEDRGLKRDQELRGLTTKWRQRVEERRAHLNHNPGTRKNIW